MKCKFCGHLDSKVIDSRINDEGTSIRRRRECLSCGKRFTTYETIESTPLYVVKNDMSRQPFDINKIKIGILKACEKRPVSLEIIDKEIDNIEKQAYSFGEKEISSKKVGDLVMSALKKLDDVAYVRFASVHRQFKDIDTFLSEINDIIKDKTKKWYNR